MLESPQKGCEVAYQRHGCPNTDEFRNHNPSDAGHSDALHATFQRPENMFHHDCLSRTTSPPGRPFECISRATPRLESPYAACAKSGSANERFPILHWRREMDRPAIFAIHPGT